jgi:hypothetical protein
VRQQGGSQYAQNLPTRPGNVQPGIGTQGAGFSRLCVVRVDPAGIGAESRFPLGAEYRPTLRVLADMLPADRHLSGFIDPLRLHEGSVGVARANRNSRCDFFLVMLKSGSRLDDTRGERGKR